MASYGTRLKTTSTSKTNLAMINHSYGHSYFILNSPLSWLLNETNLKYLRQVLDF